MSQLRAPDARPDRREGGRHGRPGTRAHSAPSRPRAAGPSPDARIRPQLLRTALLPAVAAVLSGAAAVIFTVRAGGVGSSPSLWAALGGSGALAVAAVAAAYLGANRVAGQVLDRALALRRASAQGQAELQRVVEQLRNGETVAARRPAPPPTPEADAFDLLGQEMARAQEASVAAVVQASQLFSRAGNEQKVEVFVNLARRLQSLVHREIQILDELEHEVEDPDLLKGLFHVDHLATRIRRHAENLAVLGGAVSRRQWSNPVTMTEVLRSAIAEVEQYPRVKLVPPMDGTLRGHAVADVIHLLAELVENATVFSAPHTQVLLRVQQVTAGLALEVEDRGLGMPEHEQKRMNALLSDPDQVNVAHVVDGVHQDGRQATVRQGGRGGPAEERRLEHQAPPVQPQVLLDGVGDLQHGRPPLDVGPETGQQRLGAAVHQMPCPQRPVGLHGRADVPPVRYERLRLVGVERLAQPCERVRVSLGQGGGPAGQPPRPGQSGQLRTQPRPRRTEQGVDGRPERGAVTRGGGEEVGGVPAGRQERGEQPAALREPGPHPAPPGAEHPLPVRPLQGLHAVGDLPQEVRPRSHPDPRQVLGGEVDPQHGRSRERRVRPLPATGTGYAGRGDLPRPRQERVDGVRSTPGQR